MSEWLAAAGGAAWAIVGILAALFGVLMAIRKGWGPFRQIIDWGERLNTLVAGQEEFNANQETVNQVVIKQLVPNGGGNLIRHIEDLHTKVDSLPCANGGCPAIRPRTAKDIA